jgi:hypothetical protein
MLAAVSCSCCGEDAMGEGIGTAGDTGDTSSVLLLLLS